ncbi:MAG TPA: alpha/beta hydrolase [Caulobacteraceae bacterium]|jgi:acetyl esterase/lipase|nr:alpha/beta hydrolase [Caulobacteraceae bacterium]
MPSRHLVDPEVLVLIEQFPRLELDYQTLVQTRAAMLAMRTAHPAADPEVVVTERLIPGPAGAPDVRVMISASKSEGENRPGVLHVHGGGYVLGSAEMTLPTDAAYVTRMDAVVVSVDYRLAPETPHPGPVEDCYAALAWLHAHAGDLGVDAGRVAVTGESAGGGLAAALVLLARDRGEFPVAFQHLIFPMLDDRTVLEADPSPYVGQFVWTREANRFGWASLLGQEPGGAEISPYASPARATDLAGLPPTFIMCGALDLFIEEDMDYARRLIRAGVPTELHVYPGAPHGFTMVEGAAVSKRNFHESMGAMQRALAPAAGSA